jgi:hypothetical protein
MKKYIPHIKTPHIIAMAAVSGLLAIAGTVYTQPTDQSDQSEFPVIVHQPEDQLVPLGSNATFTVIATNGPLAYQWLRNRVPINGQTNSSLTIEQVRTEDGGYYSCNVSKDMETVPTRSASLMTYTSDIDPQTGIDPIVVSGLPLPSNGMQSSCPGSYAGYINFTKTIALGWGWVPDTNTTTIFTASDGGGRTDTKIAYMGKYGDTGCDQTKVTIPNPPPSPVYRFTIYFPNNVPTTNYPIVLTGFNTNSP